MKSALPQRMVDKPDTSQPFTLKRWSQRKLAAARETPADAAMPAAAAAGASPNLSPVPSPLAPAAGSSAAAAVTAQAAPAAASELAVLPPVESLDFESDYAAFMQPKVSDETRRAALKKLFSDPSFNVMDGLDIYVGDYTQADPMPAGMLEKLSAVYAMLDPVEPPRDEQVAQGEGLPVAVPAATPEPAASAAIADEAPRAGESPANDADAAHKPT